MTKKPINCWISRNRRGILLKVEIIPEIEEFFKKWGGGIQEPPLHGRLWKPIDEQPLRLWSFEMDGPDSYKTLHRSGCALLDKSGKAVNISFLRIVGASEIGGKKFLIDAPMSTGEIEAASNQLVKAATAFYQDFIRPVNINCFVGVIDHSSTTPHGS